MKAGSIRMYGPEQWGSLEKFQKFYSSTHSLSDTGKRSVSGAINHFHKAITLQNLAIKLIPNLEEDEKELDQHGFSRAVNSSEISAVIEGIILELYSSLDCTRKVVTEIHSNYQGVPDSTRKYFQNIKKGKIDPNFPEQLIIAVNEATWYNGFRMIRDELTHHDTGRCHKDRDTGKIRYIHSGIKIKKESLIIDDIFEKLNQTFSEVNQFIERVFKYLNTKLNNEPVIQICGIFEGRAYTRFVSPHDATDFHGGVCESYKWFDLEGNPTCKFAAQCGAYNKAKKT